MAKEVDIVALGELLIDFTEAGKSDSAKSWWRTGKSFNCSLTYGVSHGIYR